MWLCLCVCCAMADEVDESNVALSRAIAVADKHASDIRIKFCTGELLVLYTLLCIIFSL